MCINKAKREDTGKYTIKVTSEAGEDTYDIVVRVIDIPSQESVKNFNFERISKKIIACMAKLASEWDFFDPGDSGSGLFIFG